jgi:cysteine-rich repeat protein
MRFLHVTCFVVVALEAGACGPADVRYSEDELDVKRPDAGSDDDAGAPCGNGSLDPGELCDPAHVAGCPSSCVVGSACQQAVLVGSAEHCNARCEFSTVSEALDGDGCCPIGVAESDDSDCRACGNGRLDPWESCDDSAGERCPTACESDEPCTDAELTGSSARCDARCQILPVERPRDGDGCCLPGSDARLDDDCQPECGNGVVEGDERCDDGNRVAEDACTNACTGAECGDGIAFRGVEACDDGNSIRNDWCVDCRVAFCGDGIRRSGEFCDFGPLNGQVGECASTCAEYVLRSTRPRRLLVTAQKYPATSAATAQADLICRGEFGADFKALVSDGRTRRGSLTPFLGDGALDWPLESGIQYTNALNWSVWITRASALLGARGDHYEDLTATFASDTREFWYGAAMNGTPSLDCDDWTSTDVARQAETLIISGTIIRTYLMPCNGLFHILCAEQ